MDNYLDGLWAASLALEFKESKRGRKSDHATVLMKRIITQQLRSELGK